MPRKSQGGKAKAEGEPGTGGDEWAEEEEGGRGEAAGPNAVAKARATQNATAIEDK